MDIRRQPKKFAHATQSPQKCHTREPNGDRRDSILRQTSADKQLDGGAQEREKGNQPNVIKHV